jgi:hypothetical protein
MKWKSAIFALLLLSARCNLAEASPAYPLEELLKRAEIVYVGRLSELAQEKQPAILSTGKGGSYISDMKIDLEVVEVLRGRNDDIKGEFGLLGLGSQTRDEDEIRLGALFLVLSQGDNYWGRQEPVIALGQPTRGQASYCGWLMFPLSKTDGDGVAAMLKSSKLENGGPLTLNRVREAVAKMRYNPDLYGKRKQ